VKRAVTIPLLAALVTLTSTLFAVADARAQVEFDGPQAAGATFGAGLLGGIVCWTVELATQERTRRGEAKPTRSDDYDRYGWYIGVAGVDAVEFIDESKEEERLSEAFAPFPVDFDMDGRHTGGIRFQAGRRCHPRFSVEVDVQWLDDFDAKLTSESQGTLQKISIAPIVGDINVKGYLLTGRIQPYLLAGVGTMSLRTESKNTNDDLSSTKETGVLIVRGGGGVDFYVDRNWVLNLGIDYLYSATNTETVDFLTIGLGVQYRF